MIDHYRLEQENLELCPIFAMTLSCVAENVHERGPDSRARVISGPQRADTSTLVRRCYTSQLGDTKAPVLGSCQGALLEADGCFANSKVHDQKSRVSFPNHRLSKTYISTVICRWDCGGAVSCPDRLQRRQHRVWLD